MQKDWNKLSTCSILRLAPKGVAYELEASYEVQKKYGVYGRLAGATGKGSGIEASVAGKYTTTASDLIVALEKGGRLSSQLTVYYSSALSFDFFASFGFRSFEQKFGMTISIT